MIFLDELARSAQFFFFRESGRMLKVTKNIKFHIKGENYGNYSGTGYGTP